ncbi:zinc-binding dehydrogenase [Microbacterium sp. 2FI]|uniref:zinc-binding dehydrogenase n=1 Tax=Microbacterium sp. 2FI TaxID=2502193 RepID=UPI0010F8BB3E|nr:zinc-binding dehydrogenase [Microbacterium sp. 2FI]
MPDVPTVTAPGAVGTPVRIDLDPPAVAMVWLGADRPHEVVAVPRVALAPGEALVAIELATICGSDVHTTAGRRRAPVPLVLGHEYVGRIVATGGDVRAIDGSLLFHGDRVVWSIMAGCGTCDRCRRGIPQKCRALVKYGHERLEPRWELTGGFASHVHLRRGTAMLRVSESVPAEVLAPASCGTATAWAAVERADDTTDIDDAVVLVLGAGLIGLTAAAIAADRGARVIVADPDARRRDLALRFGAAAAVDPLDPSAREAALADLGRAEIDVVIEASGSAAAVASAIDAVGVGGIVVLVGSVFPGGSLTVDPERLVRNLVTISGVHNYTPHDLHAAVRFLHARHTRYPFDELVGARMPLADVDAALELARSGDSVRVGLVP